MTFSDFVDEKRPHFSEQYLHWDSISTEIDILLEEYQNQMNENCYDIFRSLGININDIFGSPENLKIILNFPNCYAKGYLSKTLENWCKENQ